MKPTKANEIIGIVSHTNQGRLVSGITKGFTHQNETPN